VKLDADVSYMSYMVIAITVRHPVCFGIHRRQNKGQIVISFRLVRKYVPILMIVCRLLPSAMVVCEMKLLQNYFRGLLRLMNIFQHVRCRWNNSGSPHPLELALHAAL